MIDPDTIPKLMTTDELAAFFKVSKTTIYRLISGREISFFKVRRQILFSKEHVLVYLQKNYIESIK